MATAEAGEDMMHPAVIHPRHLLTTERERVDASRHWLVTLNDRALDWVANNVLASILLFDLAIVVPLLAIPAPDAIKLLVAIISGSWIQLWALPALQRSSNKVQARQDAKADADHAALTHIAGAVDEVLARLPERATHG